MASNPFGVSVPALDYSKPGAPTSQTYHGVGLYVNNNLIGRLQSFNVTGVYQRTLTPVRELNHQTFGRVVDIVPGINEVYKATMGRVEVWNEEIEKAFGYAKVFEDLLDQTFPFTLVEVWKKGKAVYRITHYLGAWFDDKSLQEWSAEGDARVMVNASMQFVAKKIMFTAS